MQANEISRVLAKRLFERIDAGCSSEAGAKLSLTFGLHRPYSHQKTYDSLCAPELCIVSTGLLRRPERRKELEQAPECDIVLVDEAHYARNDNRLLRTIQNSVRPHTRSLWLATATPMQLGDGRGRGPALLTNRLGH